jgi:hypothetical protein
MSSQHAQQHDQPTPSTLAAKHPHQDTASTPICDDRYPGSFFRIPGLPTPGKTTWSINS